MLVALSPVPHAPPRTRSTASHSTATWSSGSSSLGQRGLGERGARRPMQSGETTRGPWPAQPDYPATSPHTPRRLPHTRERPPRGKNETLVALSSLSRSRNTLFSSSLSTPAQPRGSSIHPKPRKGRSGSAHAHPKAPQNAHRRPPPARQPPPRAPCLPAILPAHTLATLSQAREAGTRARAPREQAQTAQMSPPQTPRRVTGQGRGGPQARSTRQAPAPP